MNPSTPLSTSTPSVGSEPGRIPRARRIGPGVIFYTGALLGAIVLALLTGAPSPGGYALIGGRVPFEFLFFALVLLGVSMFHHHTLAFSLGGLATIFTYKVIFVPDFVAFHLLHEEWHIVVNLFGLLVGFALLASYFEDSRIPLWLPRILPDRGPWGGVVLLCYVWILSSFLDNIAGAMIGGVIARTAFSGRVSIGYLAAIVAASNAGGAWSVLGDTTTTMMWIDGVPAISVFHAIIGSATALAVFALMASIAQERHQPMVIENKTEKIALDGVCIFIVVLILVGAVAANLLLDFPAAGVWAALLIGAVLRRPAWGEIPGAVKGAAFLLGLVLAAALMPVHALPAASWPTSFGLGFVSSIFDNIPLTRLALKQGGYDWGLLAYAVGFGGSMIWFGSSSGVAITKDFPEARDTWRWIREAWFIPIAYAVGFFVQLLVFPWTAPLPH